MTQGRNWPLIFFLACEAHIVPKGNKVTSGGPTIT